VSVSKERIDGLIREFGIDGYFATSAKEGWQIAELRAAIESAIDWGELPVVTSTTLFAAIKAFLLDIKKTGQLLAPVSDLLRLFEDAAAVSETSDDENLRGSFSSCIGRLENRDLIRRLSFGDYVLLQPELLDAYASAMVVTAKDEPDGLGSISEQAALGGHFHVPEEHRIKDHKQEQLLLHATIEELVQHDLALRENSVDGGYLVFPSQFNRDYEDAPEPPGRTLAISFEGPTQSLYSTLAVRLGHSGLFEITRAEMWRNAAVFGARAGGKCGLYLQEFGEARGRLTLFFDSTSAETRFHFEEYVLAHLNRRALEGSVDLVRFYVCDVCHYPVPDFYIKLLREKGNTTYHCPCGGTVPLTELRGADATRFSSEVWRMDIEADRQRNFDAFLLSAVGETRTRTFTDWAGGERVTLAIIFTDVVGSTAMGEMLKDEDMGEVRRAHFYQSRKLITRYKGREIKTIGDSFMAAFRSVEAALDYARAFQANTGDKKVRIRAGIHIGPMHVEEGDVFGSTVNYAARIVNAIKEDEIWLSESAKADIDALGARRYRNLIWERHESVDLKGFAGPCELWSVSRQRPKPIT
jgi:class 3 adenylate cyclase